jgi:hypothetical protein
MAAMPELSHVALQGNERLAASLPPGLLDRPLDEVSFQSHFFNQGEGLR